MKSFTKFSDINTSAENPISRSPSPNANSHKCDYIRSRSVDSNPKSPRSGSENSRKSRSRSPSPNENVVNNEGSRASSRNSKSRSRFIDFF